MKKIRLFILSLFALTFFVGGVSAQSSCSLITDVTLGWFDEDSMSIDNIYEGWTVLDLKEDLEFCTDTAVVVMAVVDADSTVIADEVELTSDMRLVAVAEDGSYSIYTLEVVPIPYPTIEIRKVTDDDKPSMDEYFDDWQDFDAYQMDSLLNSDEENGADDIGAFFKMVWDDDGLYVYCNITDDILNTSAEYVWNRDGLEVSTIMSEDYADRVAYQLNWKPENRVGDMKLMLQHNIQVADVPTNSSNAGSEIRDFTGFEIASYDKEDGTGYEVEYFIPWTTLNGIGNEDPFVAEVGNKFSFTIAYDDCDGATKDDGTIIRDNIAYWWDNLNMNQNAKEYALVELGGTLTSISTIVEKVSGIFPTISANTVNVNSKNFIQTISVYDIAGKRVQVIRSLKTKEEVLNVSSLNNGVYLISVMHANGNLETHRFVKK